MAVFNSVVFYLLFVTLTVANLSTYVHGTSTMIPAVSTGSTSGATTATAMTATTNAMTTQMQSSPVSTATGSTGAATTKPKTTGTPGTVVPPSPTIGNWTLRDDKGNICMRMSFAAQMNVSYTKNDRSVGTVVVNMNPSQADVTATCKSGKPGRVFKIYPYTQSDSNWNFDLTFKKSSGKFALTKVETSWLYDSRFVDSSLFGSSSESVGTDNFLDQSVMLGKSYSCVKPLNVVTGSASLQLSDMNLQPFAEEAGGNFGEAEMCNAGGVSLVVIIAAIVGAVLLIVIVSVVVIVVVKKRKRTGAAPYSNF